MPSKREHNRTTVGKSTSETGRRELLAALGMTLGSGCIEEARSLVSRDGPAQVSLSIKTLPTDSDPRAIRIAQFLAKQLREVGISVEVVPMGRVELWRDVLLNHSFDCYVGQHPSIDDPDELRTLLHSRFDAEIGWQNPFGYANLIPDTVHPLLYSTYPESQILTGQVNVNTNVFPSLHTSLSVSSALLPTEPKNRILHGDPFDSDSDEHHCRDDVSRDSLGNGRVCR